MADVAIFIADPKQSQERLKDKNFALREEIDKGSMYDEIVGSSGALQKVLSLVSKVAPTDATVLVTGETGTGKRHSRAVSPILTRFCLCQLCCHPARLDRLRVVWP
jgi:transcriptional regulator with GAF, ATPase, and Fis domain